MPDLTSLSKRGRRCALAILTLVVAGCGAQERKAAAGDVQAFLAAAHAGDRKAFEAGLDREALRTDLKAQLMTLPEIRALQSQLGEEVGDVAADRMISPEAVRQAGVALGGAPSRKDVAKALKILDRARVCLPEPKDKAQCALTFERRGRAWKLTGIHATDLKAQIPDGY